MGTTKPPSTPTRVAEDVTAHAAAVASGENRSVAEQISYWARIGMSLERAGSLGHRRVLAAAAGEAPFAELDTDERAVAHALVDARISESAASQSFGHAPRAQGQTTVSLDDDGNLVEVAADGTRRPL